MMKEIPAYQCTCCGKVLKTKRAADKHDKTCISDPEHKTCRTCLHDKEWTCEVRAYPNHFKRDCAAWIYFQY